MPAVAGMRRRVEAERVARERALGLFERQVVPQVAVVGAARAAEDHVALVGEQVVGEAQARRPVVVVGVAVVAVADVVLDVVVGVRARAMFDQSRSAATTSAGVT